MDQALNKCRILLVEDEPLVAMLMEDMLAGLGYRAASVATRLEDGLTAARNGKFDLAILDVHIKGELVFPVADILAARQIPFLFATGRGKKDIPERFRSKPLLSKPFPPEDLAVNLEYLLRHEAAYSTLTN